MAFSADIDKNSFAVSPKDKTILFAHLDQSAANIVLAEFGN